MMHKNKNKCCRVSVKITKDDNRDRAGVGVFEWRVPITGEFRVGRAVDPVAENGARLPKNDVAICETATNDDIASIGRNAFALMFDRNRGILIIRNVANKAMFSLEVAGRRYDMKATQTAQLNVSNKILLGNYTTVEIMNILVK